MVHFTCMDCQMGFQARSYEEAVEEATVKARRGDEVDDKTLVYASFCPYCGSQAIEVK